MRTRAILLLAVVGSLLFAATASARDANSDRIPDRWEKRHGLSLKVKQTHRDQDDDGFKNRAEWRAKTDPHDADSDDDGVPDVDENAGTVKSYENGTLTLTLFDGSEVAGAVTEDTQIECPKEAAPVAPAAAARDDDDEGDDDDHGGRRGDDDHGGDDDWDDGDRGDDDWDDGRGDCDEQCDDTAIVAGAKVEEASLKFTSEGRVWEELDLR